MSQQQSDQPADALYDRFLAATREALEAGLFEAAFHGLSATLHCAETLGEIARVHEVERLADETQSHIDREEPDHRIGSNAAAARGQQALFRTLVVHAGAVAARIRAADAIASAGRVSAAEHDSP